MKPHRWQGTQRPERPLRTGRIALQASTQRSLVLHPVYPRYIETAMTRDRIEDTPDEA